MGPILVVGNQERVCNDHWPSSLREYSSGLKRDGGSGANPKP